MAPGQLFLKYKVLREIGRGGMGTVFEAWDTALHRPVALKVLHSRLLANPTEAERIVTEARSAAALSHPNIVRVHTLVEHDGLTAIDMEFIEGRSLDAILKSGPIGESRAINILAQVLSALESCHKRGMVHFDLKPSNILITPEGHVFLTDFGLARAISGNEKRGAGEVSWSTPRYAPPELWSGTMPTKAWDIYSVGIVACECMLGRRTPNGQVRSAADIEQYSTGLLKELDGTSPEFKKLIESMLASKPGNRPKDASDALAALRITPEHQRFVSKHVGSTALGYPANHDGETIPIDSSLKQRVRLRWMAATAAITVCLIGVVALGIWSQYRVQPAMPALENFSTTQGAHNSDPDEFLFVDGKLYFTADDGRHGRQLWTAIPEAPRRVSVPNGKRPRALFGAATKLYFSAESPLTGSELFVCSKLGNGECSVNLVRDILPGAMGSDPECIANLGPITLFYATTTLNGGELWSTLGLEAQTGIVADLIPGAQGSMPDRPRFAVGKGVIYFLAFVHANSGMSLCAFELANGTTTVIGDVSEDAGLLEVIEDRLLFFQRDAEHGMELWTCDAATGEMQLFMDIVPGSESSNPKETCLLGARMLFQATTPATGEELWVSNGTVEGTHLLRDIRPGPIGSVPHALKAGDTYAALRADDGEHGKELWVSDGTVNGTALVADVCPGAKGSNPYNSVPKNAYIAFSADDGVHGEELWLAQKKTDQWSAQLVKDIAPGPDNSEPYDLVWTDDTRAFFAATAPEIGREVFELNVDAILIGDGITAHDLRPRESRGTKSNEQIR